MLATLDFLKGKKTYFVAFALLITALLEGVMGIDVPGVSLGDNWMEQVFAALGLGTLRAGMK